VGVDELLGREPEERTCAARGSGHDAAGLLVVGAHVLRHVDVRPGAATYQRPDEAVAIVVLHPHLDLTTDAAVGKLHGAVLLIAASAENHDLVEARMQRTLPVHRREDAAVWTVICLGLKRRRDMLALPSDGLVLLLILVGFGGRAVLRHEDGS
jgi:hypothetical protein